MRITYEDDFGRQEMQKDLILIVNPSESQNLLLPVIGLIIVSGGILFWKWRKPKAS